MSIWDEMGVLSQQQIAIDLQKKVNDDSFLNHQNAANINVQASHIHMESKLLLRSLLKRYNILIDKDARFKKDVSAGEKTDALVIESEIMLRELAGENFKLLQRFSGFSKNQQLDLLNKDHNSLIEERNFDKKIIDLFDNGADIVLMEDVKLVEKLLAEKKREILNDPLSDDEGKMLLVKLWLKAYIMQIAFNYNLRPFVENFKNKSFISDEEIKDYFVKEVRAIQKLFEKKDILNDDSRVLFDKLFYNSNICVDLLVKEDSETSEKLRFLKSKDDGLRGKILFVILEQMSAEEIFFAFSGKTHLKEAMSLNCIDSIQAGLNFEEKDNRVLGVPLNEREQYLAEPVLTEQEKRIKKLDEEDDALIAVLRKKFNIPVSKHPYLQQKLAESSDSGSWPSVENARNKSKAPWVERGLIISIAVGLAVFWYFSAH